MTWSYPGRSVDELELRLSPGENGDTVLWLEHASVAEVFSTNDPETGTWGIGPGWEAALDYLARILRGELPDAPAAQWWEPTRDDEELGNRRGHAWAAVIETELTTEGTGAKAGYLEMTRPGRRRISTRRSTFRRMPLQAVPQYHRRRPSRCE